jgi:hypothetical protein
MRYADGTPRIIADMLRDLADLRALVAQLQSTIADHEARIVVLEP